jgi:hypothetical protein
LEALVERQLEERVIEELRVLEEGSKTAGDYEEGMIKAIEEEDIAGIDGGRYEGEAPGLSAVIDLRGMGENATLAKERVAIPQIPMITTTRHSHPGVPTAASVTEVPLYNLSTVISPKASSQIQDYLVELSRRKLSSTIPRPLDVNPPPSMLGLYNTPSDIGPSLVPLLIALWRIRLWHGHGWQPVKVDGRGNLVPSSSGSDV